MDLELTDLLRATFEHLLADSKPEEVVPAVLASGWEDLVVEDEQTACRLLFETQGRTRASSRALDLVLLAELGVPHDDTAVVWPPLQHGLRPHATVGDGTIRVTGLTLAGASTAKKLAVPARRGDEVVVAVISRDGLTSTAFGGMDRSSGWHLVEGEARVEEAPVVAAGSWERLLTKAQRCIAHELVGLATAMLDEANQHVTERRQFGKPIATFQAVKHRLADVLVTVTAAERALEAAWTTPHEAPTWGAKALAARAASLAATNGMHVCGATGFLLEHPIHQLARRAQILDGLLGPGAWLRDELGARLVRGEHLPLAPGL